MLHFKLLSALSLAHDFESFLNGTEFQAVLASSSSLNSNASVLNVIIFEHFFDVASL